MVECGSIDQPPSIQNLTIWGIVTFVIMTVLGISSIYGVVEALNGSLGLWSIILLVGSGFGVAGLILVILSIYQNNPVYMKIGIFCFLVSCIVSVVLIILTLVKVKEGGLYISTFLQMALNIFLCYLFYRQSGGFTPSVAPAAS